VPQAFNTFVDDVFAFAIDMPLSHRIACLRDDVVFFVYLYQRYIYPIDKSRVNEFGRAYQDDGGSAAAATPLALEDVDTSASADAAVDAAVHGSDESDCADASDASAPSLDAPRDRLEERRRYRMGGPEGFYAAQSKAQSKAQREL
jgi:hypothetical protein